MKHDIKLKLILLLECNNASDDVLPVPPKQTKPTKVTSQFPEVPVS